MRGALYGKETSGGAGHERRVLDPVVTGSRNRSLAGRKAVAPALKARSGADLTLCLEVPSFRTDKACGLFEPTLSRACCETRLAEHRPSPLRRRRVYVPCAARSARTRQR